MYRTPETAAAPAEAPTLSPSALEDTLHAALVEAAPVLAEDPFDITDPGLPALRTQPIAAGGALPTCPMPVLQPEGQGTEAVRTTAFPLPVPAWEASGTSEDPFEEVTTDPGSPLAHLLGEPTTTDLREDPAEITDPGHASAPGIDSVAAAPIPMASLSLDLAPIPASSRMDDLCDEGTAVEWNPKWGSVPGLPQAPAAPTASSAPLPVQEPVAQPEPARRMLPWAAGLGLVAAGLAVAFFVRQTPQSPATPTVPEGLKPYVTKAEQGDVASMRLVGLRYVYGVDAPMDRAEGLRWLARAARSGSSAATQELLALGVRLEPARNVAAAR